MFLFSGGTRTLETLINFPAILIVPETGGTKPAIDRRSVDLPHPEGPKTETNDPASTFKFRESRTVVLPNFVVKLSICKNVMLSVFHPYRIIVSIKQVGRD